MRDVAASPRSTTLDPVPERTGDPEVGRVLCIGGDLALSASDVLRSAGYLVERVETGLEPDTLVRAASGFSPDIIYVSLASPEDANVAAIRQLSHDARTQPIPLLALVADSMPPGAIEAIYAQVGCDFVELGRSQVHVLARTQLLIRLARSRPNIPVIRDMVGLEIDPANDREEDRVDLHDPDTALYSAEYFFRRLPTEVARTRRYGRPLALLAVCCPNANARTDLASRVADALQQALRQCDLSARLSDDMFVCMLPETRTGDLDKVEQRLTRALDRFGIEFGIGAVSTDSCPAGISPHELLGRARSGAHARCRQ